MTRCPWLALAAGATLGAFIGCSVSAAAVCSSLSGPFCSGVSTDFAEPPPHMGASLDRDEQLVREEELNKKLKVEQVLQQYELEAAKHAGRLDETEDRLLEELSELLDETAALLAELQAEEENDSPVVGSFAFSSEGDTFDLLETMDGKEMKDFFVMAYGEVLRSWESTLEDMSPEISQGLRNSMEQLQDLEDYQAYEFKHLDESAQDNMRQRFENHRLIEVQRTFEKLIIAKNNHERQVAFEAVVYLFQLAQEEDELENEDDHHEAQPDEAASDEESGSGRV